jgi:hypothetical protein
MKEPTLNELTLNILTSLPQSVTTEELEEVAEKWGINSVEEFMNSMKQSLRDSGTSEEAIAKIEGTFNPRVSGCYREYLRKRIKDASNGLKSIIN